MAILIAMIGLMGTVAVKHTVMSATATTNDAQVAMRLATMTMEQFKNRRTVGTPTFVDQLAPVAGTAWSTAEFLDTDGTPATAMSPSNRWRRQWRVTNVGVAQPYNISVQITYGFDTGTPRTIQLDAERRKTW